jgi:hypothetical protein
MTSATDVLEDLRKQHKRLMSLGDYNTEAQHIMDLYRQVILLGTVVEDIEKAMVPLRGAMQTLKDAEEFASKPMTRAEKREAIAEAERVIERRVAGLVLPKS